MKRVFILIFALCAVTACLTACGAIKSNGEDNIINTAITVMESTETRKETIITSIVQIEIIGGKTIVTEIETNTNYSFTTKPILRKKNSPPPTAQTLVDNDILQILSYKGVLAIYEKATYKIHLL